MSVLIFNPSARAVRIALTNARMMVGLLDVLRSIMCSAWSAFSHTNFVSS